MNITISKIKKVFHSMLGADLPTQAAESTVINDLNTLIGQKADEFIDSLNETQLGIVK